eukprot:scaffold3860_cov114-Isochrysis_galbana.AAC.5
MKCGWVGGLAQGSVGAVDGVRVAHDDDDVDSHRAHTQTHSPHLAPTQATLALAAGCGLDTWIHLDTPT